MFAANCLVLLLGLVTLNCALAYDASAGCSVTLPTDIPKNSPVYLLSADGKKAFELFRPTGEITSLVNGAKMLLICPGTTSNKITAVKSKSVELTCSDGAFVSDDGSQYTLQELPCSSNPGSVLQTTEKTCSNGKGFLYEVGFELDGTQYGPLFSICYDKDNEQTFYTENVINGRAINHKITESTRKAFSASGMSHTTTKTNTYYTTNNQIARFEKLFGNSQPYITKTSFLARGHLTPDADMVFGYEQLATYYYANANPEFQVVNAGNWVRVENLARNLAAAFNDDLHIYNGVMGNLKLPQPAKSNVLVPITLDDEGIFTAPEYYFKVISHKASKSAIVMISLNNPFATEKDVNEFCPNVCSQAGVADSNFSTLEKGYTFCCSFNEFKKHYADLPNDIVASKLLTKP